MGFKDYIKEGNKLLGEEQINEAVKVVSLSDLTKDVTQTLKKIQSGLKKEDEYNKLDKEALVKLLVSRDKEIRTLLGRIPNARQVSGSK